MTTEAESLFQIALQLPERDRAELAAKLMESIDAETEDDWNAAWDAEIAKRIEELDQGKVKTIPWAEVRRMMLESKK